MGRLGWGILGTGKIARIFARSLLDSERGRLAAVASRSQDRADALAREFGADHAHGSYAALVEDAGVDIVYVATPHTTHLEWGGRSAAAGKHVLCEKPLTVNLREATLLVDAARQSDVFLMEAFAYRCHPQTARLLELIRDGWIGEIRFVEAVFGYDAGPAPPNYLLVHELAGGSILDVGCYTASMARLVAGVARGSAVAEPDGVRGAGHIGSSSRVDHYAVASLRFPGGIVGSLASGVQVDLGERLRILGSEGTITVPSPWLPGRGGAPTRLLLERGGSDPREIVVESGRDLYAIEADAVASFLEDGHRSAAAMPWEDTLGNMETLDRWRASIGLEYDMEMADQAVGRGGRVSEADG